MHLTDGMKRQQFNKLYKREVVEPLEAQGFEVIGKKSLRHSDGLRDLRLIILGGQFAKPNTIRTVICFRHSFLRPIQKGHVGDDVFDVVEFPRKLSFFDFSGVFVPPVWRSQLNHWGYDSVDYSIESDLQVTERLKIMTTLMIDRVLPWAKTLTPQHELTKIRKLSDLSWHEQQWLEDYEAFVEGKSSADRM
jgi:hypothetical protein